MSDSNTVAGKRKRIPPVTTDEAVSSGKWRVAGWNGDGSERLVPAWPRLPDGCIRPVPSRAKSRAKNESFTNESFTTELAGKKTRENASEDQEVETYGIEAEENISEEMVTSTRTESERVEKRKNPFVCIWDWAKALWQGDELGVESKRMRFGDG